MSTTTTELTPSARIAIRVGVPISLAAGCAMSFSGQMELAHSIGWDYRSAWLLPTAVIVYEAVATIVWSGTPAGTPARRRAAWNALLAILVSLALNSTWHLLHPGTGPVAVTLGVSAVPNLVVAALLHMSMAVPVPEPETSPVGKVPVPVTSPVGKVPELLPAREAELPALGEPGSKLGARDLPVAASSSQVGSKARPKVRARGTGGERKIPEATLQAAVEVLQGAIKDNRPVEKVRSTELREVCSGTDSWRRAVLRAARKHVAEAPVPEPAAT